MKYLASILACLALATTAFPPAVFAATKVASVTHHHITWTFDKEHTVGQFVTGDPWVLGPVKIVAITNDLNDPALPVLEGEGGSMINPTVDNSSFGASQKQGYDEKLQNYSEELNAGRPNGQALSKNNPIVLTPGQSLVTSVPWLKGGVRPPTYLGGSIRAMSVLTCLAEAPPEGSFRPTFAGAEKKIFNVSQLRPDRLLKLDPVGHLTNDPLPVGATPLYLQPPIPGTHKPAPLTIAALLRATQRPWVNHVPGWYGGEQLNPTENLPNYGRAKAAVLTQAMLALQLDWDKIEGKPKKDELMHNLAQIGIDLTGVADAGGYWPADGGHGHTRLPAILFAGLLLDDEHMKNAGHWDTRFQDTEQTLYVTEEMVERTQAAWENNAEKLATGFHTFLPYTKDMIGMPEWSIQPLSTDPRFGFGGAGWLIGYRDINASAIPGFALVFLMMEDGRKLFKHDAYFDYADRLKSSGEPLFNPWHNRPPALTQAMWTAYRNQFPSAYDKKWDAPAILEYITQPKAQ